MSLTITRKVSVSGGTVLRAANNLGDVASAATSRTNLGLGSGDSPSFTDVNVGNSVVFAAPSAAGKRYILTGTNNSGTGSLVVQAGGGSSAWGGTFNLFETAHATRGGWATVGLGVSGAKFTINNFGFADGTDVFTVDRDGATTIASTSAIKGVRTATHTPAIGSLTAGSGATTNVTVTGAAIGDAVTVNSTDGSGIGDVWKVTAQVTATNTVSIRVVNIGTTTQTSYTQPLRVTVTSF